MMYIRIPKPIPRGCPSGPGLPLSLMLTCRLLWSVGATQAQSPAGFQFAKVIG
jgi:hypothetical protein